MEQDKNNPLLLFSRAPDLLFDDECFGNDWTNIMTTPNRSCRQITIHFLHGFLPTDNTHALILVLGKT